LPQGLWLQVCLKTGAQGLVFESKMLWLKLDPIEKDRFDLRSGLFTQCAGF